MSDPFLAVVNQLCRRMQKQAGKVCAAVARGPCPVLELCWLRARSGTFSTSLVFPLQLCWLPVPRKTPPPVQTSWPCKCTDFYLSDCAPVLRKQEGGAEVLMLCGKHSKINTFQVLSCSVA